MNEVQTIELEKYKWLALRHKYLNASEVGAFYDPKAYKSELELYYEKIQPAPPEQEFSIRMEAGKFKEPFIAFCYQQIHEISLSEYQGYIVHDNEIMACTPDYIHPATDQLVCNDGERITIEDGEGLVEMKCANPYSFKHNYCQGEPALKYIVQLQHQMACTGHKWGMILTLVDDGELDISIYKRDTRFINIHEKKCLAFMDRIKNRVEPAPKSKDEELRILHQLYPTNYEQAEDLSSDDSLSDLLYKYTAHRLEKKVANTELCLARNLIKQRIQGIRDVTCNQFRIKQTDKSLRITETSL